MKTVKLYHTSDRKIEKPDVYYGRRNADFGGGFYLSDSFGFAKKWATKNNAYVNEYTLDLTGLKVKELSLNESWLDYILKNRFGYSDIFADADLITGPIANDTLYDTFGLISSGLIKNDDCLKLLSVGKRYVQFNVKSEKAAAQLKWQGAVLLSDEELNDSEKSVRAEEREFREAFMTALSKLDNFDEIDRILS